MKPLVMTLAALWATILINVFLIEYFIINNFHFRYPAWIDALPWMMLGMCGLFSSLAFWGARRRIKRRQLEDRPMAFLCAWIALTGTIVSVFTLWVLLNYPWTFSPRTKQLSDMRGIGEKLIRHDLDHDAATGDALKGKSVEELVTMGVLSEMDATYLREHQVQFDGYDPDEKNGRTPIFEALYPLRAPSARLIVFQDGSATINELKPVKPAP